VLAVTLIVSIVALMNSIPLSVKEIFGYTKQFTGLTPRGDASIVDALEKTAREEAPKPLDRLIRARASNAEVQSLVGPWPFAVYGMEQDDMRWFVERMKGRLEGRWPEPGQPEAIVSEPVARNLGLKMGDSILGPDDSDRFSPQEVKIVGMVQGSEWMILTDIDYHSANHFPPVDGLMLFAGSAEDQAALDAWAQERFKGEPVRVFAWPLLEEETDAMFRHLYRILNVVIATLVIVITIMMAMLMNIHQAQRTQEFGLLQAIGYERSRLVRRILGEISIVVIGGWLLGAGLAYGFMRLVKAQYMDPQAFSLNPVDPVAYLYTIPVPIVIFAAALITVLRRFAESDPVAIVERRLA
jgi:putative ABC transport system permease protein/lipoprotein-releasing system permease protein